MASGRFFFENFALDPADRQLRRGDVVIELNARYFDALALLVREQGKLVSKDRFLGEVWHGIAVTDEALTQCIKTIRRQLGDNAANPHFIETVPKHGYRFIAAVEWVLEEVSAADAPTTVVGGTAGLEMSAATSTIGTPTTAAGTPTSNSAADGTVTSQTLSGTPTFGITGTSTSLTAAGTPTFSSIGTVTYDTYDRAPASASDGTATFTEGTPTSSVAGIAGTPTFQSTSAATSTSQTVPLPLMPYSWQQFFLLGGAGTAGGGIAGLLGGVFYGFAGFSESLQSGMGAISVLLVIVCLSILMGMAGGAGISFGIAAANFAPDRTWQWSILGGSVGGIIVGAFVKMLGLDAFNLLLGQSPGDITGAGEGALLGAAVGFALWLGSRSAKSPLLKRSVIVATVAGGAVSILIHFVGGRLMGGSLDLLAHSFPNSRFHLDQIGVLFGESDFGPISQIVTGAFEGALFAGCIVGAMLIARQKLSV